MIREKYRKLLKILPFAAILVLLAIPSEINPTTGSEDRLGRPGYVISRYDALFQRVAYETGLDWHLLSAIAYKESRFRPELRSRRGAVGIMQITRTTARHYNIPYEMLDDPALNVRIAARLFCEMEGSLNLRSASEDDRVRIVLAGYNCGITNLKESRRMASAAGADCNRWDELKHFGKVNNRQTRRFVEGVMAKWNEYRSCTASLPQSEDRP